VSAGVNRDCGYEMIEAEAAPDKAPEIREKKDGGRGES
jgi:hypothetical protein